MRIGVFGTGMVGETIATKLVAAGHDVKLGARSATNEKATAWAAKQGKPTATHGTFADAAKHGELVFNCTRGDAAVTVVTSAGNDNLRGKILVDVTNPLDFSKGMPPVLFTAGNDSLAEQIQRAVPDALVVKALNTVSCEIMVDASRIGDSDMFISGNDAAAKTTVSRFLREQFGWKNVVDLGDLTTARGTEGYLPLWLRLWGALGTADFNIKIVRK